VTRCHQQTDDELFEEQLAILYYSIKEVISQCYVQGLMLYLHALLGSWL